MASLADFFPVSPAAEQTGSGVSVWNARGTAEMRPAGLQQTMLSPFRDKVPSEVSTSPVKISEIDVGVYSRTTCSTT